MIIIYDSLTGQTKKFAVNLGYEAFPIQNYIGHPDDNIFLVTRSYDFGEVPKSTLKFLNTYRDKVVGVAVSGNRIWGHNYGKAGETIEKNYGIPLVLKFEMSGLRSDIEYVKNWIQSL